MGDFLAELSMAISVAYKDREPAAYIVQQNPIGEVHRWDLLTIFFADLSVRLDPSSSRKGRMEA